MDAGYDPNIGYLPFEERSVAYMPYEQVPEGRMPPIPQPHYNSGAGWKSERGLRGFNYCANREGCLSWDSQKMFAYFGIGMAVIVSAVIIIVILKRKGGK